MLEKENAEKIIKSQIWLFLIFVHHQMFPADVHNVIVVPMRSYGFYSGSLFIVGSVFYSCFYVLDIFLLIPEQKAEP